MREESAPAPIRLYWWAKKPNFGDSIGPWLVSMICGAPTVNVRGRPTGEVGLATVGSLVHSLDRPGLSIWGSGSICSLKDDHIASLADKRPAAIHALRGWKTYKEVTTKLGWQAPRNFGDPALLMPRFYAPKRCSEAVGRIAVVPHYSHKPYCAKLEDDRIHVVDVQQDVEQVVDEIAGARCVLSSSLHGLIIAHAYEVPWVWLRVRDHHVLGGDFKFEDFFTVIHRAGVRVVTIDPGALTNERISAIANFAYLPKSKFTFDALLESFPRDSLQRGVLQDADTSAHFDAGSYRRSVR